MRYRVIALDLDGTLLTAQKTILPESLAVLRQAEQEGVKVILVTGRHHVAIRPFYQALNLTTPAICCNGTYLYDYPRSQVLSGNGLSRDKALRLIDLIAQQQIEGLMYVDEAMLYLANSTKIDAHVARTRQWASALPPEQRPVFNQVDSFIDEAHAVNAIWKFALIDSDQPKLQQFTRQVSDELDLNCEWSWHDQVDIIAGGNSKGARLAEWVASQGLDMENVIAFGDNQNDISMLERVGLGVAMGNAIDEVKSRADLVIETNEQPSIAQAITRYVL